jgi:hypothetical protein
MGGIEGRVLLLSCLITSTFLCSHWFYSTVAGVYGAESDDGLGCLSQTEVYGCGT